MTNIVYCRILASKHYVHITLMTILRKHKRGLILFLALAIYLITALWLQSSYGMPYYVPYIYLPLQNIRSHVLQYLPFSLGDLIYIGLLIWLLISLFRFVRNIILSHRLGKHIVGNQLLRFAATLVFLYASFIILWGANYKREPLIPESQSTLDTATLIALNDTLVAEINRLPNTDNPLNLAQINQRINIDYQNMFGPKVPLLNVKPTLFGSSLHYFGIQGYYNPLTGEGQFATSLPPFMWGFVVAHEMAHQAGIASEGDANFIAYMICVQDSMPGMQYSGYLNLFLYANRELFEIDSTMGKAKYEALNATVREDIEALKKLRKQYKSSFRGLSIDVYHWYLQNRGLKQGIGSYRLISKKVYEWELDGKPKISLYP
ncbi:hypothetical protein D3C71_140500 [compost metagenome]